MSQRAIVVLGHGSRAPEATAQFRQLVDQLAARIPDAVVLPAFMELAEPSLSEAVREAVGRGADDVSVLPAFLFVGNHIKLDIPSKVARVAEEHPSAAFRTLEPIGPDPRVADVLLDRIGWPDLGARDLAPPEIEAASMRLIDSALAERELSDAERAVARRIVHATGDVAVGAALLFAPGAAEAGVRALASGASVVTDVRMVATGVDSKRLERLGGRVLCAVDDPAVATQAAESGRTRAATAIRSLAAELDGAVVAIGNAPTALREVIAMHAEGAKPALVIGMPVGFIDAPESKTALAATDLPFITLPGTRGGSPLAAAAVNALIRLAEGDSAHS